MTADILLVLIFLAGAIFLFIMDWFSVDLVTLLMLALLVITGILTPEEAFSGFANEIIIILCSVFVLSAALVSTGVMDWLGGRVLQLSGHVEINVTLYLMLLTAFLSAIINNTTATAILIPAVLGIAHKAGISASRLLIPVAFASMLGGTCTVIGTSTNVAASGLVQKLGLQPFSLFEFFPIGVTVVAAGSLFLTFWGRRLLPDIPTAGLEAHRDIQSYLSEVVVPPSSSLVGQSLSDAPLSELGLSALAVLRNDERIFPQATTRLRAHDSVIVHGPREGLLRLKETPELVIESEKREGDLISETLKIVEAAVMPQSILIGRSLREVRFRQHYGLSVLAVQRRGHVFPTEVADLSLKAGDVLLLQGPQEQFDSLERGRDLWILSDVEYIPFRKRKGLYAVTALGIALILGGLEILPLSIAFLLTALAVIAFRCITVEQVYGFIEWRLIVLIGGMTSFGLAMQKTQAADYLAALIGDLTQPLGIHFILLGFALLTILLTQPLSNAAAVLVVLPVALSTATQLDLNPRTFAVLVTLSASLSFIAPFEPACILVYGAGKYRFRDFVKAGLPLTLVTLTILILLIPVFWPL